MPPTAPPRLSFQTLKVLRSFLVAKEPTMAGADIARSTQLRSGTLYPILLRLERCGWLLSEWESIDPREAGRPRRRLYRLSGTGHNEAVKAINEVAPSGEGAVWTY